MYRNPEMSVIAYANGFTLWQYYAKTDTVADVMADGYFNQIYTLCGLGDKIMVVASDGYVELVITKIDTKYVGTEQLTKVLSWQKEE